MPFTVAGGIRAFWKRVSASPAEQVRRHADSLAAAGDVGTAIARLEEAISAFPEDAALCRDRAKLARTAGDRDGEECFEREALARDPSSAEAARALLAIEAWRRKPVMDAWAKLRAGGAIEARAAFFEALGACGARVPAGSRAEILSGLGLCHLELGDHPWAADAFWEALGADPDYVLARKGLGIAWYRLGRYEDAEQLFGALLAQRDDLGDAWSFHGWCAYSRGRWSDALERFERARAADPGLADARWGRSWCCVRLDRAADACAEFRHALALGAVHPSRLDLLALAFFDARFAELLEPVAAALARFGLAQEVEAKLSAMEMGRSTPAGDRVRAELARSHGDELLDALEELIQGRASEVGARLEGHVATSREQRMRAEWLRARAARRSGDFEGARAIVERELRRQPRHPRWLELRGELSPAAAD